MLKKLLRYEFKSISKVLVPLLLAIIAAALFSALLITLNSRLFVSKGTENMISIVFTMITNLLFGLSLFAVLASIFIVFFMILNRYYKNFFGDEGYLTFTLPAKTSTHLLAKTISGLIWTIIGVITVSLAGLILAVFGTGAQGTLVNMSIFKMVGDIVRLAVDMLGVTNAILFIFEFLVMAVVSITSQLLMYYLAITLGSIIAKKHKLLASIGMYIVINSVLSVLTSFALIPAMALGEGTQNSLNSFLMTGHAYMLLGIIVSLATGGICFFFCNKMLETKLNLE